MRRNHCLKDEGEHSWTSLIPTSFADGVTTGGSASEGGTRHSRSRMRRVGDHRYGIAHVTCASCLMKTVRPASLDV